MKTTSIKYLLFFLLVSFVFIGSVSATTCPIYETVKSRILTASDLSSCGCGELELLRNEVYARHGRVFNRKDLQSFFEKHSWYQRGVPDKTGTAGQNRFEQKNVVKILNTEKTRACKKGSSKSKGTYSAKSAEDKEILEVALQYVDANSADIKYKLKILKKLDKWALVDVIPLQELDPHMVILEKVGGFWKAREMGTLLVEWEEKVPELFK